MEGAKQRHCKRRLLTPLPRYVSNISKQSRSGGTRGTDVNKIISKNAKGVACCKIKRKAKVKEANSAFRNFERQQSSSPRTSWCKYETNLAAAFTCKQRTLSFNGKIEEVHATSTVRQPGNSMSNSTERGCISIAAGRYSACHFQHTTSIIV